MTGLFPRFIPLFRLGLAGALAVISYLAVTPMQHAVSELAIDKVNHLVAFLVLAGLVDFSFPRQGFTPVKIAALLGYGLLIEAVQFFLPFREFSLLDITADALGLGIYAVLRPLCRYLPILRERWQPAE